MNHSRGFEKRFAWSNYLWIFLLGLALLPGARWVRAQTEPATNGEGRKFTGQVLDKITNKPISGAIVTLSRETAREPEKWDVISKQELTTDADGHFEFTVSAAELADKHFCIETKVRHPKYASLPQEGGGLSQLLNDMKEGEQPWFAHLKMAPGEEVSGTIRDPDGKALTNCDVEYISIVGDEQTAGIKTGNDIAGDTIKTDANGRFSFLAIKGAELTYFSAEPEDYAVLTHRVGGQRGDLGAFRVARGAQISGVVTDSDGKPMTTLHVEARSDTRTTTGREAAWRKATTDAGGKFTLAPVGPDTYQITVDDERFLPVKLKITDSQNPAPIEFRSPPLNTIRVHFVDSSGNPSKFRNRVSVSAVKGDVWFHTDFVGDGAEAELREPKGMEDTSLGLLFRDDCTMLWRVGKEGDWRRCDEMNLGLLQADMTDVTVMQFKSPKLIVRAIDTDGKPLTNFKPLIYYTSASMRCPSNMSWFHDIKGDVGFTPSSDGQSWKSSEMMIPGREFDLTVNANGYEHAHEKMKLGEDETREITIQLKRAPK